MGRSASCDVRPGVRGVRECGSGGLVLRGARVVASARTRQSAWPPGIESVRGQALWCVLGGVLLFRVRVGAVPLALGFLASGFGMGPGVSSPL